MCLGIPGRIEDISVAATDDSMGLIMREGMVSFGGTKKKVNLAYVPEANVGDYVIVHVGFAISRLNEKEATRIFETLRELGEISP